MQKRVKRAMTETAREEREPGGAGQGTPLMATKLFIPAVRLHLLSRPRLTTRLDEALRLGHKLTLISAPAGFGKTTLLIDWIRGKDGTDAAPRIGWVSLDEADDDVARFLAYLIAALQRLHEGFGSGMLAALQSPQPPPIESLLTALINQLATWPLPAAPDGRYVLVLDDYHTVKAPAVHDAVAFLLDHLPAQVHLIIVSRSDPVLSLARLRGRGQLTELRAADLRFTPAETADFLNAVMGLGLAAGDMAALAARTEGWITGLQLAAISLQGRDPEHVPAFLEDFTGSHRFVLDYLVEEVLQRQPAAVQAFLFQTSVLGRFCGPLCDAVLGTGQAGTGAQSTLEYLEAANLFVVALDDQRHWYRYHRLFADLLRARLKQRGGELGCAPAGTLHRRASEWYEHGGFVDEAVHHALAARDLERAARLVEENGLQMLLHGELTTLLRWVAALPDACVRPRPRLCVYHAWALVLTGQPDAAEPWLQCAEEVLAEREQQRPGTRPPIAGDPGSAEGATLLGHVAAIRAYAAALGGDAPHTIELAQQALALLPEDEGVVRSVVAFTLGGTYLLGGDVAAAGEAFAKASRMGRAAGNMNLAISALCHQARVQIEQGRLRRAAETYRQALEWATGPKGELLPVAAQYYSGRAELLYEWNDLEGAAQALEKGIELAKQWGNVEALAADYGGLAQVYQAQGDPGRATDMVRRAEQVISEHTVSPLVPATVAAYWPNLWLAQKDLAAAENWVRERGLDADDEPAYRFEFEYLTLARVLVAVRRPGEASELLERLLGAAQAGGRTGRTIEIRALQALALQAQGATALALEVLERALALAEPEGYVRSFVDRGEAMKELLSALGAQRPPAATGYVRALLAAFDRETGVQTADSSLVPGPAAPATGQFEGLIEPLSPRELEVLRLVAAGLTNREIADRLVIAVSTVKSHTNSIYGKLDVSNRTQAVARARTLELF
jgi:LuxR family maltose regulon positive regulatory protein